MRAQRDRQQILALTRPRRKHVAHAVNLNGAAQGFALRLEPVAHPLVLIGNRQPLDAALHRAAKLRGVHNAVPQALRIDHKIGFRGHVFFLQFGKFFITFAAQPIKEWFIGFKP